MLDERLLHLLLDLDPALESDREAYDDDAVKTTFLHHPNSSAEECRQLLAIQGVPPLFAAVGLGASLDVVKQIYYADPQAMEVERMHLCLKKMSSWIGLITPLHVACRYGSSSDVIKFLTGANPEALMPYHSKSPSLYFIDSPLHLAVLNGASLEVVRIIVQRIREREPNAHLQSRASLIGQPWTPLHCACRRRKSSVELVRLLIEADPTSLQVKDRKRQTPLHLAVEGRQSLDVIKLLVESCPEVLLMKDGNNRTPLHRALESPYICPDVAKFLIDIQPDVLRDRMSVSAMTALHTVCRKGASFPLLRPVLEGYPEAAEARDREGRTPIHHACERWAQLRSLDLLATANPASLKMQDYRGRTPLYCACESSAPLEIVQFLVEQREESIFIGDDRGRTPLDIAKNHEVKNLLLGVKDISEGCLSNKRAKELFLNWCETKWWAGVWRVVKIKPSVVYSLELDVLVMAEFLSKVGHDHEAQLMWELIRGNPSIVDCLAF